MIGLGFIFLGFPSGIIDISIMVDLKNTFMNKYKYPDNLAGDFTSSVYMSANLLGDSIGPLYGGFITYNYGFDNACITTSAVNLIFCLIFSIVYKEYLSYNQNMSPDECDTTLYGLEPDNLGYFQLENKNI